MNTVLQQGYIVARKDYHSDANCLFDWCRDTKGIIRVADLYNLGMSDEEVHTVLEADKTKFRIVIGERHYSQKGIYDGQIYHFRAPVGIHEILVKYELYGEED